MRFSQRQVLFLISAGIVILTVVAYEPIRHNDFVSYDDTAYITENPNVTGGITQESVIWAFTNSHMGNWHPLTMLSHMLDYEIFRLNPLGHHFINVLFHILNALLIFWILTSITGAMWPSAFVAAVFALHPLQVESVAWAAERKTVLSGFFWFLTIAAYIWYAKRRGIGRYILLFMVYALCIMTKPVVATLPMVLLLLDYWPLERFNLERHPAEKSVPLSWIFIEKIPLLVLSAILSIATIAAQKNVGAFIPVDAVPLGYRIANMFFSYTKYIGKTIWPSRLAAFYPYPNATFLTTAATICAPLLVLISVIIIYAGRRRKYAAMGWLWYIGTLVPMIGLIQVGEQGIADRYMYIPILGLLVIVAWVVRNFVSNRPRWKAAVSVLAAVALLSAVIVTQTQVRYWQNSMSLFGNALKVTKNNHVAEKGYGSALFAAGRLDEAIVHLRNALKTHPGYIAAGSELGRVYLKQGKFNEATTCFNELLKRNKNNAELYENIGNAYVQSGKYDLAVRNWAKALDLKPNTTEILNNLAWTLATTGDVSVQDANKAIELAQRACELTGYKNPTFLDTLAAAYAAAGRFDDAVKTAKQALDIAKSGGQEDLINEIQNHIKLYQAGQPYRQK